LRKKKIYICTRAILRDASTRSADFDIESRKIRMEFGVTILKSGRESDLVHSSRGKGGMHQVRDSLKIAHAFHIRDKGMEDERRMQSGTETGMRPGHGARRMDGFSERRRDQCATLPTSGLKCHETSSCDVSRNSPSLSLRFSPSLSLLLFFFLHIPCVLTFHDSW